jgi:hypothetical protein
MPCPCRAGPWPWQVVFRTAWSWRGIACVNQTRPYCVNPMGNTQSKYLAVRHDRGNGMSAAWGRHGRGTGTSWYVWISLKKYNTYYRIYTQLPPDDGPLASPKHVDVQWLNKLKINSASSWFHYTLHVKFWGLHYNNQENSRQQIG